MADSTTNSQRDYGYLEDQINQLKKLIEDSYYRIPKDDFEVVTRQKITQEVTDLLGKKITSWRNWAALIIGALSFFGFSQVSSILNKMEDKNVKHLDELNRQIELQISAALDSKLNDINLSLRNSTKDQIERIDAQASLQSSLVQSKLNLINHEMAKVATEQTRDELSLIKDDLQMAFRVSLRSDLHSIMQDYNNRRYKIYEALNLMERTVETAMRLGETTTAAFGLEQMIYIVFVDAQYEKVVDLYNKYKHNNLNLDFTETGLKNVCLSNLLLYEEIYSPVYRQNVIETYTETLKKRPDHSHAHTMRIVLHVIDYERSVNTNERENALTGLRQYVKGVASSSDSGFVAEVVDYLDALSDVGLSNYVNNLYALIPDEMEALNRKANGSVTKLSEQ